MTIILRLIEGNDIKSGVTLQDLVNEGWVEFIDMDLSYELDTNQLNAVIYEALKLSSMYGKKPTAGALYERINSAGFKKR